MDGEDGDGAALGRGRPPSEDDEGAGLGEDDDGAALREDGRRARTTKARGSARPAARRRRQQSGTWRGWRGAPRRSSGATASAAAKRPSLSPSVRSSIDAGKTFVGWLGLSCAAHVNKTNLLLDQQATAKIA